jgi:hypothetical protein
MEPTREALDAYYARVTQNWPLSTLEFWRATRGPDPAQYRMW